MIPAVRDQLFQRHVGNPILTAAGWPHTVNAVFNPGAALLPDGTTLLLCRVEDRRGISSLWAARSADGTSNWLIDPEPALFPSTQAHPEEAWGVEDPRIVWLEELKRYAITYTAYSPTGPAVSLILTADFRDYERVGVVIPPEDKDAALLPRRFGGRWLMLHRPRTGLGSDIWLSESPDLVHWGRHRLLLAARKGAWWDANKIGLGPPLIETDRGWLMLYHGMRQTAAGCLYRLGLALLDHEDPGRVLQRSDEWIFGPHESYERQGDVGDVVFPCGATLGPDGDTLNLYYGAADSCVALATGRVSELLHWLEGHCRQPCDSASVD
ncbi:glycosidase [candidate division WOR-3 bacterium]|nr:glycosidase [candidate division WOR-3 bacterium]